LTSDEARALREGEFIILYLIINIRWKASYFV